MLIKLHESALVILQIALLYGAAAAPCARVIQLLVLKVLELLHHVLDEDFLILHLVLQFLDFKVFVRGHQLFLFFTASPLVWFQRYREFLRWANPENLTWLLSLIVITFNRCCEYLTGFILNGLELLLQRLRGSGFWRHRSLFLRLFKWLLLLIHLDFAAFIRCLEVAAAPALNFIALPDRSRLLVVFLLLN